MRTTKRFTPQVLARFERLERSTGTREHYTAWHQVTRGDPASRGRSHMLRWRDRVRDLLSDGELGLQLFASMVPGLEDCCEQYRLSVEVSKHPLAAYDTAGPGGDFPGTLELSRQLGIKHPRVFGEKTVCDWSLTTDMVLVVRDSGQQPALMPLSYKPDATVLSPRATQLLQLERAYWQARGARWLLITRQQADQAVVETLRRCAAWALDDDVGAEAQTIAARIALDLVGHTLTDTLHYIANELGDLGLAQRALWQSVWAATLPIDLRRQWRPHEPLRIVSREEFLAFNPICAGRSAWI